MTAVLRSIPATLAVLLLTTGHPSAQVVMQPRDARPPQQQPPNVGTAAIAGSVRMAGSTQPARKVRVSLSSPEIRGGRTAITDDDGRFSFTALPAGRYTLSAMLAQDAPRVGRWLADEARRQAGLMTHTAPTFRAIATHWEQRALTTSELVSHATRDAEMRSMPGGFSAGD